MRWTAPTCRRRSGLPEWLPTDPVVSRVLSVRKEWSFYSELRMASAPTGAIRLHQRSGQTVYRVRAGKTYSITADFKTLEAALDAVQLAATVEWDMSFNSHRGRNDWVGDGTGP